MTAKEPEVKFEKSLAELRGIVEKLEKGELELDESLKLFERGVAKRLGRVPIPEDPFHARADDRGVPLMF